MGKKVKWKGFVFTLEEDENAQPIGVVLEFPRRYNAIGKTPDVAYGDEVRTHVWRKIPPDGIPIILTDKTLKNDDDEVIFVRIYEKGVIITPAKKRDIKIGCIEDFLTGDWTIHGPTMKVLKFA